MAQKLSKVIVRAPEGPIEISAENVAEFVPVPGGFASVAMRVGTDAVRVFHGFPVEVFYEISSIVTPGKGKAA